MTTFSLNLLEKDLNILKDVLIREDKCERAAYLLCNKARSNNDPWDQHAHEKYLVTKVITIHDDEILDATPTRITWRTRSFVRALKEAAEKNQTVAVVHSHTSNYTKFSGQDDTNEPDLLVGAQNRNGPSTRILSLILTDNNQLFGRIWLHPSPKGYVALSMIRVIGSRIALHYDSRSNKINSNVLHRQALAFGETLNRDLRKLRIAIVGCGATGSAVAMMLARLGVGQLILFDKDIVDQTNLNRLHGSRQADADAMRPKVEVVAREITNLGLGVRTVAVNRWIGDADCRDALKSSDIIFGCTDDHEGRILMNRFAYYYLTPLIDIGFAIDVSNDDIPEIKAMDARVSVIGPGNTCLLCHQVINPAIAAEQALKRMNPTEYESRKAEAYVFGEGNPSPSVVTFTTELACMGINELIHRLQGFRGENGHAPNRVRRFHLNEDRRPNRPPQSYCPLCGSEDNWGAGDREPFLGIVN